MTERIFVTGAAGFLGRYLIEEALAQGLSVVGVDRTDCPTELHCEWVRAELPSEIFAHVLRTMNPYVLIHAAGTASVQASLVDPLNDFQQNVSVFASVLESVHRFASACRVVLISSAAVYGNPDQVPTTEKAPTKPVSPYGYHKLLCEVLGREYYQIYGVKFAAARVFSAYGDGLRKQVLWDICQKALQQNVVEMAGTGDETRDFIHAHDIARGIFLLAEQAQFNGDIYNLANGEAVKIQDLAQMLVKALSRETPVQFSGIQRAGDPLKWQADIHALRTLGFVPQVKLVDGVTAYAQWVIAQKGAA